MSDIFESRSISPAFSFTPESLDYDLSPSSKFPPNQDYEDLSSSDFSFTPESLHYAFSHVSPSAELLKYDYDDRQHSRSLARAVHAAAQAYIARVDETSVPQWHFVTRMLDNLQQSVSSSMSDRDRVVSQLQAMQVGDVLVFPIPSHKCAVVLTKQKTCTLLESLSFDMDAKPPIRSYPSFAAEVAVHVPENVDFQLKLANLLRDLHGAQGSYRFSESRSPQFIDLLRKDILCGGIGHAIDVSPIIKHSCPPKYPHEFSYWKFHLPLWLMIRLAIQMSLPRSHGRGSYKAFILFFLSTIASNANISSLPMQLVHSMGCKILRRLSKLESSSIPDWLSKTALKACASLREVLEPRLYELRHSPSSPFRNPTQHELERDTRLSLKNSRAYIRNALENHPRSEHLNTTFHPSHHLRGTLDDFLSESGEFFNKAYKGSSGIALYDVEKVVEEGIDDWIAQVVDVDVACAQLEKLMDSYMWGLQGSHTWNPGERSVYFLMGIELFVAMDKLILKEVPMLADYSPEIPLDALEGLFLRKSTNLHRLSCAYQYLSSRQSRSRMGWSVLLDEGCLPARYYDHSVHLQHLKARIEEEYQAQELVEGAGATQLPLPTSPLHAKVVVFERQCPPCIRTWRSAAARFVYHLSEDSNFRYEHRDVEKERLFSEASATLEGHFVDDPAARFLFVHIQFACEQLPNNPHMLCYAVSRLSAVYDSGKQAMRQYTHTLYEDVTLQPTIFRVESQSKEGTTSTSRTPNDALAGQAFCAEDVSLDEFVALRQLRCGGSLQWLNILHGLRSRTLNIRNPDVHELLYVAVSHVGPCNSDTGKWLLHQELEDLSFSNMLLEELENLLVDVGFCSIDAQLMRTISLLVLRILAASPSETTSVQAITLLRRVRRKLFDWVQELCYNVGKDPTNEERQRYLLDMSAACQSTFDVDATSLPKHFQSAEDLGAALSHTLLTDVLRSTEFESMTTRLSVVLESILGNVVIEDASDRALDLVVCMIFPRHKPGQSKWERLPSPNTCWLTCRIRETIDEPSQVVHINHLIGEFRVEGRRIDNLEHAIREFEYSWNLQFFLSTFSGCLWSQLFVIQAMESATLSRIQQCKIYLFCHCGNGAKQPQDNTSDVASRYTNSASSSPSSSLCLFPDHPKGIKWTVRMQCSNSKDIIQWIPSEILRNDLPPILVDGHIHWLNLTKRTIEICTREQPLELLSTVERWRVDCSSQTGHFRAYKDHETLVDVHSTTWAMVSEHFKCLRVSGEIPKKITWNEWGIKVQIDLARRAKSILITTLPTRSQVEPRLQLSVSLPWHGLSFFVNEQGELESHDFKNMVFDDRQCVETLFGVNFLVLRLKAHLPEELSFRRIIVPNGEPVAKKNQSAMAHRVQFQLPLQSQFEPSAYYQKDSFKYHIYDADTELGCLAGSGSVSSMQLLADMHAVTSLVMPDPLTGKTGAQASSCLSNSGACRSKSFKDYFPIDRTRRNIYQNGYSKPTVTLHQLFSIRPAPKLSSRRVLLPDGFKRRSEDTPKLNRLPPSLETNQTHSTFQQDYVAHLRVSAQHIQHDSHHIFMSTGEDQIERLTKHYTECRTTYFTSLETLKQTLSPIQISGLQQELYQFGQWPSVTGDNLLRCLASTTTASISDEWKKCLILLALSLLDLQRARRLLRFSLDGLEDEFSRELGNDVCDGWNPEEYPDWLLIQIQGNFLVRRSQAEVAMEIMSPKSRTNTVIQVNMGEGKSSVIIPIAAATLADGNQLVRVIAPKALTSQMFEILVSRLGYLANRPIYNLHFSRSPEHNDNREKINGPIKVDELNNLMLDCMAERGILLMEPQHVASLKLMVSVQQIQKDISGSDTSSSAHRSFYEHVRASLSLNLRLSKNGFVGSMFRRPGQIVNRPQIQRTFSWESDENDRVVLDATESEESKWLSLQKWMDLHVRDILDESDDILHPRFQLLYTLGLQQHIDGYSERWSIVQEVLHLLKECAHVLAKSYPNIVEIEGSTQGLFPHISITQGSEDVGRHMIRMVVEHVMAGRIPTLDFRSVLPDLRDAIRSFITDKDVLQIPEIAKKVEEYAKHSDQSFMWGGLLLLRGLVVSNIPLFAVSERRWRVDYGLNMRARVSQYHQSTRLAVPYRAKDVPAPGNTQFGHPDLTIILTCLSYYYSGLGEQELRSSFEILLDHMDDPHAEYARWIKDYDDSSLPDSLRELSELNLRSSEQWDKIIFPLFTRNQRTINFYLSRVVFPREMKEFPWKISASSWDLAERRTRPITGFSGTNDIRWLLPMSIGQYDLDHQQGTNAKVLAYLLRSENDFYVTTHANGKRLETLDLLRMVAAQQPEIRVLLDVGAQILDFSNHQVAEMWLNIVHDVVAAIYFNEENQLEVLTRNGNITPIGSSAISNQLGRCVVYIDHVHTRGTDLKLPVGSRAAVTLGPKLTKDSLVQGCMRMRKLGRGHSVIFFAPPEVDLSIRTLKKDPNSQVTSADILGWTIHETWADMQHWAPYWAKQGMDHKARQEAWAHVCKKGLTKEMSNVWLQPAIQTLEDLYAPREVNGSLLELEPSIRQRCKDLGVLSLPSARMDEEQEREVQREREREREEVLPPPAEPAEHFLHPDVVIFVETGVIPSSWLYSSNAFQPIFTALERSSAVPREADIWSPFILATTDFCTTIKPESTSGTIDQYLRPVQWILSTKRDPNVLVLISPFEACILLPKIRGSGYVHLHLYAPRKSKRMKPTDDLKFYVIPPLPSDWTPPWALIDQLNLFSGQLYLRDYPSYLRLCRFLCIPTEDSPNATAARWNVFDLFRNPKGRERMFSHSPLPFVMGLLAIRTRGRPFGHTHMGRILYGQVLTEKDFDDSQAVVSHERRLRSN